MKQLGFQPELEVWTVWTRSGRSGHGLRCLEPGQKFRKFNSDHFPFFKNLYRTFASRVSLPWLEIGSGRSGNGVRCLEPGQNFRKFNSEHFPFWKNFNPASVWTLSNPQSLLNSARRAQRHQKSKMFRIEFPKLVAWFQTPQTVSRPSRPNFHPHRTIDHTSQK